MLTSLEMVVVIARVEQVGTVPQILLAPSTFTLGLSLLLLVLGCCCLCYMVDAAADAPVAAVVVVLLAISGRVGGGLVAAFA